MPSTEERVPGEHLRPLYGFPSGDRKHPSLRDIARRSEREQLFWRLFALIAITDIMGLAFIIASIWTGGNS